MYINIYPSALLLNVLCSILHEQAAEASLWNSLEIYNLRLHPRSTESVCAF